MRVLRFLLSLMFVFVLVAPINTGADATQMSVKRLTAWNLEKKSATATAGLRNLVVEGKDGQLFALRIEPATLQVRKLTNIFTRGRLKGPSWAPGTVEILSEPRLPRYGDWVYVIARSGGITYLMNIHVSGGGVRYFRIPDTKIGNALIRWSPVWFQLSLTGDRFVSIVSGRVITAGKSEICTGLVSMSTEGKGFKILATPKWDGEKFYVGDNDIGKLVAPIGLSRRSGEIFFKAELGNSGKHGIYMCKCDGSALKLIKKSDGVYRQTISSSGACSLDYATDNGKYLILNNHNIDHENAITIDAKTGQVVAFLSHKCKGVSDDGLYSFFQDETGFGFEFTVGGNPITMIKPNESNYPATADLNNNTDYCPPRGNITVNPFGFLALSETDVTSKGQVYFIGLTKLPVPKKSELVVEPQVCDFGIIDEDESVKLNIQNASGAVLSGDAHIISTQGLNPFKLSDDESTKFTNISDLVVYGSVKSLSEGSTYERAVMLKAHCGEMEIPAILTVNDPNRLMARIGLDRTTAWVSTNRIELDNAPFSKDGVTMVPLRFIIDLLPCDFTWDAQNMKAILDYQQYHFEIGVGEEFCVDGESVIKVSAPAMIKGGQMFIPLRLTTEVFDAQIKWFGASRSILLSFKLPEWGRETLVVEGVPSGAKVALNYAQKGATPLTLNHMKQGRYMIEITKDGYRPYSTIIELPMDDSGENNINRKLYYLERIVPTTTVLTVNSKPEGAYVYIGDKPLNVTPCEVETKPGLQTLRVSHPDYPAYVEQIVCLAGHELSFDIDFETEKEKLSKLVEPMSLSGEIDCNHDDELTFDITIVNQMNVTQAFRVECPDGLPLGFDSVSIETVTSDETVHDTPRIAHGERISFEVSVKIDDWISPGDVLESDIVIQAKDYNSWQYRLPIKVTVTGKEIGSTKLDISAPTDVDVDDTFDVLMTAKDVFDLRALTTKFIYNPKKIELLGIYPGELFDGYKKTIFSWREPTAGEIRIAGPVLLDGTQSVEGDGILIRLRFKAKIDGNAVLDFSKVRLYDSDGDEIEHNIINTWVVTVWEKKTDPNPEP